MSTFFRDYQPGLLPAWLQGRWGSAWATAFGVLKDSVGESLRQASQARITRVAPDDALQAIGEETGIERGPSELLATYRGRLLKPFSTARERGTDLGIVDVMTGIGYTARCKRNNQWDWDGHPGNVSGYWARMWVIFDPGGHPFSPPPTCGSGLMCGSAPPTTLCGIVGATLDVIAQIRRLVKKTRDSMVQVVHEIIVFVAPLCGDGGLVAGGGSPCGAKAAYLEGW